MSTVVLGRQSEHRYFLAAAVVQAALVICALSFEQTDYRGAPFAIR